MDGVPAFNSQISASWTNFSVVGRYGDDGDPGDDGNDGVDGMDGDTFNTWESVSLIARTEHIGLASNSEVDRWISVTEAADAGTSLRFTRTTFILHEETDMGM